MLSVDKQLYQIFMLWECDVTQLIAASANNVKEIQTLYLLDITL